MLCISPGSVSVGWTLSEVSGSELVSSGVLNFLDTLVQHRHRGWLCVKVDLSNSREPMI